MPFDLPLELRNQVARIEIAGERSAGAVNLIDAATQWHRVGSDFGREPRTGAAACWRRSTISRRALRPTPNFRLSKDANLAAGLDTLLKHNVSVLLLADIGTLPEESAKQVDDFVKRVACSCALPARALKKAATICCPSRCASAAVRSAARCRGRRRSRLPRLTRQARSRACAVPTDVHVNRQVLADPARLTADVEIWARLADGTPLVTATQAAARADSSCSTSPPTPIGRTCRSRACSSTCCAASRPWAASRRRAVAADTTDASTSSLRFGCSEMAVLPPLKTLDGFGALKPPPPTAEADQGVAKSRNASASAWSIRPVTTALPAARAPSTC